MLSRTAKQTALCQSAGDEPQNCVRLLRYSYWLLRQSILNLANRIFADLQARIQDFEMGGEFL